MDDEDCVRRVVRRMLERLGYETETACDGSEAVRAFATSQREGRPFSAAILDLTVRGGVGGVATLRALREIDPDVPAAASTGDASHEVVRDLRALGFSAVLVKPYSIEELASVAERLCAVGSRVRHPGVRD